MEAPGLDKADPYTAADLDRDRDLYGDADRVTGLAGGMIGDRPAPAADRDTTGVRKY